MKFRKFNEKTASELQTKFGIHETTIKRWEMTGIPEKYFTTGLFTIGGFTLLELRNKLTAKYGRKVNQEEVATKVQTVFQHYTRWEGGKNNPNKFYKEALISFYTKEFPELADEKG